MAEEAGFFERDQGAAAAPLGPNYARRQPEKTVLHQVICENLETLLAEAREGDPDGRGLPAFVEREFRRYLACGILGRGFVRWECRGCGDEGVIGLSCKCRGFCPSCVARRMDDTAAHLVDRVLPFAPYRQWVLSLPFHLRVRLARNEELLGAVRRIFHGAVRAWQRRQARALGLVDAETAAVCFTQRFGSRLDINPHLHSLVPDAVFVENTEARVELRELPKPRQEDVERIVRRIARRVKKLLERWGDEPEQPDALDSLRGRQLALLALSPPVKLHDGRLSARVDGFSLHAARHLHAHDREGLEKLCRYGLRPPLALSRLSLADDGDVVVKLRRALPDGRERLGLSPMALMRRLAGLVPHPRVHQIHYYGAFASHAGMRGRVVPHSPRRTSWCSCPEDEPAPGQLDLPLQPRTVPRALLEAGTGELIKAPAPRARTLDWSSLLRRTFGATLLDCKCGGRREIVAYVSEPEKAREILARLGIVSEEPKMARARGPPQRELFEEPPGFAADPTYPDD